ncbi:MAG: hypothetical protein NTU95_10170 [Methanothrix sp.]|nr:hypothetical protein [Methanothrix sp.]
MIMICYRHHALLTAIMIVIVAFFLSGMGWAVDASPKDDAYHYMPNGVDDQLYNEWWYFNVADNDTQFQVVYLLSDPDNISSARKIQVQAVAMQDDRPYAMGVHQSRGYGGDRNSPMFDIDKSGFSTEEEPNLRVRGEVEDRATGDPIRWDLVYQPTARPWFAIPVQVHIGHLKGDWMKWLVYMPSAQVTGTLTIGNITKSLQGIGYHEHAWGRFALSDPQIIRASVSVPLDGFCLAFAEISGEQRAAFLGIEKDGKSIAFRDMQIKINYSNYSFDNKTAAVFPDAYHVLADNGDYSLDLEVDVQKSAATTLDYQPPLPSVLIFQQVSILQGTLKSKSGEKFSFQKQGFSAFTMAIHNAPWVAEGDRMKLEMREPGKANSTAAAFLSINLSEGWQEVNL